jgi:hypothetical protein
MTVLALLGAKALWLTYAWLLSAIVASYLSHRKGYGDRPGLASGLLLNVVGILVWLVVPAKPESLWKQVGPFKRRSGIAQAGSAPGGTAGPPPAETSGPGTEKPTPGA